MTLESDSSLTYREAGVDIDKANQAKKRIKELARSTFNTSVLTEIGAFAGAFRPDLSGIRTPVLLASADGVGTKLKIAFMTGIHDSVGVDLVSHCANDILVLGAVPLFFLDYIAAGQLEPGIVEKVVEGLAKGCRDARCVLLGGETAEMPDFYRPGEYDLAGFIVGLADQSRVLTADRVAEGDVLVGLHSSGLHTNGYSLVRRLLFDHMKLDVNDYVSEFGRTVGEELLVPHRCYLECVLPILQQDRLHALAHVTGGGITENLDRVLPPGLDALVQRSGWVVPPVFRYLQKAGRVEEQEMLRTFNMGIGLILVVPPTQLDAVGASLQEHGQAFSLLGTVRPGAGKVLYQ